MTNFAWEAPTPGLRFVDGRLEQQWQTDSKLEWRKVPALRTLGSTGELEDLDAPCVGAGCG